MGIQTFTFSPGLTQAFVRFGYDHYRDDPQWIPPFEDELLAQLSPEFNFHRTTGNNHMNFLATAGNKVVGRVSAMVNRELKDRDGQAVGTIGFFESVNDYAVAKQLLEHATGWLVREQKIKRIWGPMNFDIWHGYRLMTRGFERKPFYGEPYNKPYYAEFFEHYGFTPKQHWHTFEISGHAELQHLTRTESSRFSALTAQGYRFPAIDLARYRDELRKLHSVLSRSFAGFLGFTMLSSAEFERLFLPMRHAVHPRLFLFAYDPAGHLCGFAVALREVSAAIRAMRGRNDWIARARFLYHRCCAHRINFYLIGKTPERYRSDLGRALFSRVVKAALDQRYQSALFSLVARGNPSRNLLRNVAADESREYILYELNR